jgi:hypothetical protein
MAALVTTPKANADAPTLQLAVTVAVTAMGPDAVPAQAMGAAQRRAMAQAARVKEWGAMNGIRIFRGAAAHSPVGIKPPQMGEWCAC